MRKWWLGPLVALAACGEVAPEDLSQGESALVSPDVRPNGRSGGLARQWAGPARPRSTSNGITYNGGPVMLGTVNVYFVWYGNWNASTTPALLRDFASNIGGSEYYAINTTYPDGAGRRPSNVVRVAGETTTDGYPYGASLSDSAIRSVVSDAIAQKRLPADANGAYFVVTSSDVTASSGFCTSYCGWHTHAASNGIDMKYSFIGDPARCPNACAWQWGASPNGDPSADGMASILAHELEEMNTDPDLNAWYDRRGYENADKCAWTFGSTYKVGNGSLANVRLGTRDWLVQQNWVNAGGGYCAMGYTGAVTVR